MRGEVRKLECDDSFTQKKQSLKIKERRDKNGNGNTCLQRSLEKSICRHVTAIKRWQNPGATQMTYNGCILAL